MEYEQELRKLASEELFSDTTLDTDELSRIAMSVTGKAKPNKVIDELNSSAELRMLFKERVRCAIKIANDALSKNKNSNNQSDSDSTNLARDLYKSLISTPHGWAGPILSVLITIGFFIILYMVLNASFDSTKINKDLVFLLVGTMTASFTQVVNFWLGSSRSSNEKTNMIFKEFANRTQPTGTEKGPKK